MSPKVTDGAPSRRAKRTSASARSSGGGGSSSVLAQMHSPMRALGLLIPGVRGRILRDIDRARSTMEQHESFEEIHQKMVDASELMLKGVGGTMQLMKQIRNTSQNHEVARQMSIDKLDEHLTELRGIHDNVSRLEEREKDVRERELFARESLARLQQQLAVGGELHEQIQATSEQANTLLSGAQSLHERAQDTELRVEKDRVALDERQRALDTFRTQLQAREEASARALQDLDDLARKKESLNSELDRIHAKCKEREEEADRIVRDRELAVAAREAEASTISMLLVEREHALHERELEFEERTKALDASLQAARDVEAELGARKLEIDQLTEKINALQKQREDLNRLVASLSANL